MAASQSSPSHQVAGQNHCSLASSPGECDVIPAVLGPKYSLLLWFYKFLIKYLLLILLLIYIKNGPRGPEVMKTMML